MKWKSNAQGGTSLESGTIFKLKAPANVVIHKYVGCGDTWLLSCTPLGIERENLHTADFDDAVDSAKFIVRATLNKLLDEYAPFAADASANELVRY